MAQTEITGEDQIANSVQTGSTALPHKAIPSESSAFTHSHTQETSHVFENGFEAAEPPVPSDPGNNSYPAPNPLTSQPELLGEDLMPQQNGIQSAMHEAEPVFESSTRTTADGNSANLSSEPEEPEAAPELPAKDMSLPVNRRMWFVRVPRPADDHTIKLLEREMESYKAQVRLLNESLAVKRVEKDSAKESTQAAWDSLNACKGQVNSKQAALEPLRGARDARNSANKEFRSAFGDLDVRSEEELDARLAAIRHTIEHESIPLSEEKRLMKQMSTLSSQRERVRKYAAAHATIGSSREDADRNHASLKELEAENKALWEEKKLASGILTKYKDEEKIVDDALKDIFTERRRIKDLQDEVYARLQESRRVHRAKLDDFYDNRRMSQVVRSMIKENKVEEARGVCRQQTEEKLTQLGSDVAYRGQYNLLWQQQRNQPISLGGDCDLGTGYVEPSMEPSPPSKGASAAGNAREALSSIGSKVASTLNGAAQSVKAATKAEAPAAKPAASQPASQAAKPAASQPAAPLPKPSPQKAVPSPAKPAAMPNGIANGAAPISFVLPSLARSAEPELSEEEQKAKVREQNRLAAEEAELRKERRKRDQEKKKAKAMDKRQQREAAEKQRLETEAAAAAAKAAEPEPAEEATEEVTAATATASAQDDALSQPAIGRGGARMRPRAKRSNFDVKTFWRQYSTQIIVVGLGILALILFNICYSLFASYTD